jgi:hypothetical protein
MPLPRSGVIRQWRIFRFCEYFHYLLSTLPDIGRREQSGWLSHRTTYALVQARTGMTVHYGSQA